jgi:hypothetical protein
MNKIIAIDKINTAEPKKFSAIFIRSMYPKKIVNKLSKNDIPDKDCIHLSNNNL